jgi:hypothetical protein
MFRLAADRPWAFSPATPGGDVKSPAKSDRLLLAITVLVLAELR